MIIKHITYWNKSFQPFNVIKATWGFSGKLNNNLPYKTLEAFIWKWYNFLWLLFLFGPKYLISVQSETRNKSFQPFNMFKVIFGFSIKLNNNLPYEILRSIDLKKIYNLSWFFTFFFIQSI